MTFVKGKSGNPSKKFSKTNQPAPGTNGRKPKLPDLDVLMAKVLGDEQNGMTAMESILVTLHAEVLKGGSSGMRAAEILMNRGYGMPKQKIDIKGVVETKSDKKSPVVKLPDGTILEL